MIEPSTTAANISGFIVIFGEVLWDCFEDVHVLGGAPLNVAWNLAGFGHEPLLISAVGDDDFGHRAIEQMQSRGLSTDGLAIVPGLRTGIVDVDLLGGQPRYDIITEVAYDHRPRVDGILREQIEDRCDEVIRLGGSPILYHGSLAYRSETTRSTLTEIRQNWRGSLFFDVNVRQPHFSSVWLDDLMPGTSTIKLNDDELRQLTGLPTSSIEEVALAARQLLTRYRDLRTILLTRGALGAMRFDRERAEPINVDAPPPQPMLDTVGAGDAFASVILDDLLTCSGASFPSPGDHEHAITVEAAHHRATLRRAVSHASRVCTLAGATSHDRGFYRSLREVK